jgi:hypothetical protein
MWPDQLAITGALAAALSLTIALTTVSTAATVIGIAIFVGMVAAAVAGFRAAFPRVVSGYEGCRFQGVPISGPAFHLLVDIQQRFAYAQRMIGQLPTGLRWSDVDEEVRTLLWETLPNAARVSAMDREISDLRYAAAGTPQAALLRTLIEGRAEHLEIMRQTQQEAESLARTAGNAVAAARVALARTGDISRLEVAAPTVRAIMARSSLAEARARLAILVDVWTELDDSTALLAEKLELDHPPDVEP